MGFASWPYLTLLGDMSASDRYYERDIAVPNFILNDDSMLDAPSDPGLGVRVDRERLAASQLR